MYSKFLGILFFVAIGGVALGCASDKLGAPLLVDGFQFPVGLAVHEEGYAIVGSANFDLGYISGSVSVVDLNGLAADLEKPISDRKDLTYRQFIMPDKGIATDNFSGTLALSPDGKLAALTVRENDQLLLFDVEVQVDGGEADLNLSCWPSTSRPSGNFPKCDGARHRIALSEKDPYDILLMDGPETEEGRQRTAYVSFLQSGNVAVIDIPASRDDVPRVLYTLNTGVAGSSDLARSPTSGLVFVTSRFPQTLSNPVHYFDPDLGEAADVHRVDFFDRFLGNETRSIAFATDGLTAGLVTSNPDMLVLLDTSPDYTGRPINAFLGTVGLGSNPSRVTALGDLMFVTGAKDDTIYVVDAMARRLVAVLEDVCRGPFEIAFWDRGDLKWGLVTCFEDSTLAVFDADQSSASFLDVLARVGKPNK